MLFTLVLSTQYAALQISTLSLHDALPISLQAGNRLQPAVRQSVRRTQVDNAEQRGAVGQPDDARRLESPCVVRLANGTPLFCVIDLGPSDRLPDSGLKPVSSLKRDRKSVV